MSTGECHYTRGRYWPFFHPQNELLLPVLTAVNLQAVFSISLYRLLSAAIALPARCATKVQILQPCQ